MNCKDELVKAEYESLRAEIESAKTRLFKLFIGGISLPVALLAVLVKFPELINTIILTMPIIILAVYFRYEYERKVITRAGLYIRKKIEPRSGGCLEWETWLTSSGNRVKARTPLTISFKLISAAYYFSPAYIKLNRDYVLWFEAPNDYFFSNWLFLLFYWASIFLWIALIQKSFKREKRS